MPDFGFVPAALKVHLDPDSDFIQTLTSTGAAFPAGAVITLLIGAPGAGRASWAATVSGLTATWNVDKAAVAALRALAVAQLPAELTYSDAAGVDLTWMRGCVVWHG